MWHLRQELGVFARNHADCSGDGDSFVVAHDEDRYNATHEHFIAPFDMFNDMTLGDVVLEQHIDGWTLGEWLCQWKVTDFDKEASGDFNIVARTLMAAAEASFPHLACSSEAAAVAAFLELGEQLPADILYSRTISTGGRASSGSPT